MGKKVRRASEPPDAVLVALETVTGTGGKAAVSLADLRDRLLQMSPLDLDERLLALERDGKLQLEAARPGEAATTRERRAALFDHRRGLLAYARLRRATRGSAPEPEPRSVTLNVRVPVSLLEALDRYVSIEPGNVSTNKKSRARAARTLLARILDRRADDRRLASLRSAILSAIAAAARLTGTATLWDVRQRLAAIPQDELDRVLLALEARGALVLAPRPEGIPETDSEARGALWCASRGALSRVELPGTKKRHGTGRTG